ncbi:MEDS domain-containing protein [Actinomadura keratinilytica]|jgi:anti-anti-sigma factor|uniref:STAS domain-containing protein n=1 Tax=Actinomadura keratinilytica TaxID=547461 RepID=A0ABP7YB41_9ACTN
MSGPDGGWFTERAVGELRPGDHGWLAYRTPEEREHVIGDFVHDGLRGTEEKVVYVTDAPPERLPGVRRLAAAALADRLRRRQLRVLPLERTCLDRAGRFDPPRLADAVAREVESAFGQEFRAVRVTTELGRLPAAPGPAALTRMLSCEHLVDQAVAPSTTAMAVCQVHRAALPRAELAALRDAHEVLVAVNPEYDDGVLRLVRTFEPHGLRVEGELDAARHAVFADRLARVTALRRRAHLDLSGLRFIDVAGLSLLARHATGVPGGRGLVLDDVPPGVAELIDMVGRHRLPGLLQGRRGSAPARGS